MIFAASIRAGGAAIQRSPHSSEPATAQRDPAEAGDSLATEEARVFVFRDNFWVNLHHFLRAESRRYMLEIPLGLSLSTLEADERTAWQASLDAYADLATRSFAFDEALAQIDNTLTMLSGPTLNTSAIDPKFVVALNRAAPIYRRYRWSQDHLENQQWIAAHAALITERGAATRAAIGNVFHITPPKGPILVDVVADVGPNLAYTTQGAVGFSGHTFISPKANSNSDVALDTICHETSHTMDDQIIAVIAGEATRQHVKIPSDMWHAITLYTTYQLVRRERGRTSDDPSYAPNRAFAGQFEQGAWPTIFADLQTYWLPYLEGHGNLDEALAAVVRNAPR